MPIAAISVNMFTLRLTREAHPRVKNGQPPQRTTGVARTNCTKVRRRLENTCWIGCAGNMSDMASSKRGTVRITLIQNRRVMSTSSGFAASSRLTVCGSRAIPQMGQVPGSDWTISGCMGQTYVLCVRGTGAVTGSRAMPQRGHAPGPAWRTSGCMGQVYTVPAPCPPPWVSWTWAGVTHCAGSARNCARQCGLQKAYVMPSLVHLLDLDDGLLLRVNGKADRLSGLHLLQE